MTTERPMLFSAPMIRALLAGTKSQTRRVVKWRGAAPGLNLGFSGLSAFKECHGWSLSSRGIGGQWEDRTASTPCPYGQPGDRLWVKEQTLKVEDHGWIGPVYTESDVGRQALEWGHGEPDDPDHIPPHAIKRRPSLFMSRAMSRITLEIVSVRVERLQAISRGDAMAEGCPFPNMAAGPNPRDWYRELWDQINGAGAWDANPWVWAVSFKRVEG